MRIRLTSVIVDDQEKAKVFYTEVLGFLLAKDFPAGEHHWLTVVSAEDPDGVELLLEPDANPASRVYQRALFDESIPAAAFASADVQAEYERLRELGVRFPQPPLPMGPTVMAVFEDTCGNLIQLYQTP